MIKKILIYGLGVFFSKIVVFLLVPIYTRSFSPSDYGYYDVLISNIMMVVSISFIEIWSGVIRFIFDDNRPYRPIKVFLKLFPILIGVYLIAFVILSQIMDLKYPTLSLIYGIAYLLFSVFNSICRGLQRNVDFILSGAISTLFSCLLGLWFVLVLHKGISSLLTAQIIGYLSAVVYIEVRTNALWVSFQEEVPYRSTKEMIQYCIPLMINAFSFLFLGTYNKNIIFHQLGETASGYYAFILKFTSILSILISIFSLAWQETAFQNANAEERAKIYSYYINIFIKFFGSGIAVYCLLLYCAAPVIGGKEYVPATQYIPLAITGTFIAEISGILGVIIAVSKKTLSILISTIVGAFVNVIIVTYLTKQAGINVANVGLCLGFLCAAIYRYYTGKKLFKIKLNLMNILVMILEMAITLFCFYYGNMKLVVVFALLFTFIWALINKRELKLVLYQLQRIYER